MNLIRLTLRRLNVNKTKSSVVLVLIAIVLILGTVFAFVSLDNGELGLYDYKAYPNNIKLGLDLKGGVYAVFGVNENELSDALKDDDSALNDALAGTADSLENLLFSKGYTEAVVSKSGVGKGTKIRVEVPDVDDPEAIFDLIGRPKTLHFKETKDNKFDDANVILDGSNIESANVTLDQNGKYAVSLEFDDEGTKAFAEATQRLTGKPIYIYVNRELLIEPTVNSAINDGKALISGNYTYDSAYELAVAIQSGSFAVPLSKTESATISPTLGDSAIKSGIIAGGVGLLFIVIFLSAMYGMMGVAASISLIWYTMTYVFFLSIFPWVQLTLPGIAGILLSIGMAVDANVIIFERIKEEYRMSSNKSIGTYIKSGFKRSLSAIIDGNVTTIIGAVVLMFIATSSIKGFAITLLIGIVISLISSLLITRLILKCFLAFTENPKAYALRKKAKELPEDLVAVTSNEGGKE